MEFKLPDKLTFKRKEVISITRLDGKVLDYWEKEFNSLKPIVNNVGEKFYTRGHLELILRIKDLLVARKLSKEEARDVLSRECLSESVMVVKPEERDEKLRAIRQELKEILTILDKHDKN